MTPDFWLQILAAVAAAAGVYVAIRVDLTIAKMRAEEAHRRMDEHLELQHNQRKG
jgi:hypothetical protein